MNTHHTPGPWRAEGASVYSEAHERDYSTNPKDAPYIWRVVSVVNGKTDEEIRANFALIAAAPELLFAAEALVAYLGRCTNDPLNPCWDNRQNDRVGMHWGMGHACAYCTARGAIAKATQS